MGTKIFQKGAKSSAPQSWKGAGKAVGRRREGVGKGLVKRELFWGKLRRNGRLVRIGKGPYEV
jgi:hypothetical protein